MTDNNISRLVNELLSSPQFRSSIENAVQCNIRNPSSSGVNRVDPLEVTQLNAPSTSTHINEELRRLFRPNRVSKSTTTKKWNCNKDKKTFKRDVILAVGPNVIRTLTGFNKVEAYDKGFAISAVIFEKNWDEHDVYQYIRTLFPEKLKENINFQIMVPIGGRLVKPNLASNSRLNGETICQIFYQKQIYIRPDVQLCNVDEECNENIVDGERFDQSTNFVEENFQHMNPSANSSVEDTNLKNISKLPENFSLEDETFNISNTNISLEQNESDFLDHDNSQFENDTQIAIEKSLREESLSLNDILKPIRDNINEDNISIFNIYRGEVFQCCIRAIRRKSFDPFNTISAKFTDIEGNTEGAIDNGGPKREMFRLLFEDLQSSRLFEGNEKSKYISFNSDAVKKNEYFMAGKLISLAVIHCGIGPRFFSDLLFSCIINEEHNVMPTIEHISDLSVKEEIQSIENAISLQELQDAVNNSPIMNLVGRIYCKDISEKQAFVEDAVKFYSIHRVKSALAQLIDGLKTAGIYEKMLLYPYFFKTIMCYETRQLEAQDIENLLEINYTVDGSNGKQKEIKLIAFWRDYLLDCEENETTDVEKVLLEDVLCFLTGLKEIPLFGISNAQLNFLHTEPLCPFPKANTCAVQLYLPIMHDSYDNFKYHMDYGIKNGQVFGFS